MTVNDLLTNDKALTKEAGFDSSNLELLSKYLSPETAKGTYDAMKPEGFFANRGFMGPTTAAIGGAAAPKLLSSTVAPWMSRSPFLEAFKKGMSRKSGDIGDVLQSVPYRGNAKLPLKLGNMGVSKTLFKSKGRTAAIAALIASLAAVSARKKGKQETSSNVFQYAQNQEAMKAMREAMARKSYKKPSFFSNLFSR